MRKILHVGDIHLADTPPEMRLSGYKEEILDKIDQTFVIAEKENVDLIIWAGDVFHAKNSRNIPYSLVNLLADRIEKNKRRLIINPGQHDLGIGNIESICKRPIWSLSFIPNVTVINTKTAIIDDMFFVTGVSITVEEIIRDSLRSKYWFIHQYISPPKWKYHYFCFNPVDLYTSSVKLVAYGDIHDCHGVYEVNGVTFVNFGSISRGSLNENDYFRDVSVGIIEIDESINVRRVSLNTRPACDVFKVGIKKVEDDYSKLMSVFADTTRHVQINKITISSLRDLIKLKPDVFKDEVETLLLEVENE